MQSKKPEARANRTEYINRNNKVVIPFLQSDHFDITFSLSTRVSELSRQTTAYFTFNYSRGDYEGLYEHLSCTDFTTCYLSYDVEYIWHVIEHQLISAIQLFIPANKIHSDRHPVWFNSEIRHSIKCLRTLRRKYKRHPTLHTSNIIDTLESSLQDKIKTAKQNYESHLIANNASANNSEIFIYLKSITKSNDIPPVIKFNSSTANTDCSKANLLNQYFYAVFHSSFSPASPVCPPITCEYLDSITVSITDVYE